MEEGPMKRIALLLAAATLGTGCIVVDDDDPGPTGTLDMTWFFVRTKHDASTVSYTCFDAGVDTVVVSYGAGGSRSFACDNGSYDGAVDTRAPVGSQTVTLTGYRGNAALYQSFFNVTVAENQTVLLDADVWGIPDDLDIYARFLDRHGVAEWTTCAAAGVDTITWSLVDWAGTVVDSNSHACTNPAGVSYRGAAAIDRDQYVIRMQAFETGSAFEVFDSASTQLSATNPVACDGQAFDHYGPSIDPFAWDVWLFDVTLNSTFCP
jgi:hypothetical protein